MKDFIIIMAIMIPFRSAIADWNHVPTGSMKPSIIEGDRVFVNKLAYDLKIPLTTFHLAKWSDPQRNDIVVFFSPADEMRLVKRVIGIPGDVVAMRNNILYINGQPAKYLVLNNDVVDAIPPSERSAYIFSLEQAEGKEHPVIITPSRSAIQSFGPVQVPENQYLMLGDNRDNSADSRYFGFVERKRIIGKASSVVASFNRENLYLPRLNRFFKHLL
ncbi:MAG: signal peptidase I [Kiritimatiellae bacterium]|nr:signal peptidase I [Kiritimatiellia bacterium]MDD5522108.1 signal peptidase I [Kiritimatiellia bacterium]